MTVTIERKTTLTILDCCTCGYPIALTQDHEKRLRDEGEWFYCPAGHHQHFTKSNVKRLQEQLDAANARAAKQESRAQIAEGLVQAAERKTKAARAELARVNKRTAAGVCPCCNRTFQQLARHMKTKHPESAR